MKTTTGKSDPTASVGGLNSATSNNLIPDYLRLPDRHRSERGMTAGISLSPLLAAVMLLAPVELIWVTHVFGPLAGLAGLAVFALLCRRPLARLMRQALGLPRDGFGPGAGEAR